jgi:hypothetical protein
MDQRFEHSVIGELVLRERQARRRSHPTLPRLLAERLHEGQDDLLSHLRRVAHAVPSSFRPVAWLHHAHEATVGRADLRWAGLAPTEELAIGLIARREAARPAPRPTPITHRVAGASGRAIGLAQVVGRASLRDGLREPATLGGELPASPRRVAR